MATKLVGSVMGPNGKLERRSTEVERISADGKYLIKLTVEGLMLKEKGRRMWIGPFDYGTLYLQGVRAKVNMPAAPKAKHSRGQVSRGLLATGSGR